MKRKNGKNGNIKGFTLIELVITLVISGILFVAIGAVVMESQVQWMKQGKTAENFDDELYARRFIEWQIRSSTGPYRVNDTGTQIEFYGYNESFKDIYDNATTTYRKIYFGEKNIAYFEEHSSTSVSGMITRKTVADEVIISSVTRFVITPNPTGPHSMISRSSPADLSILKSTVTLYGFNIGHKKTVMHADNAVVRFSTFSFTVSSRNY